MPIRDTLGGGLVCAENQGAGAPRQGVKALGFAVDSDSPREFRAGLT